MTAVPCESGAPERDQTLASTMVFLDKGIDQSSAMLQELTVCLSDVIVALGDLDKSPDIGPLILRATQALQNEDRIQQRLCDLRRTLQLVEHALQTGVGPDAADLDHAIINQLHLDEMRNAYAASVGMVDFGIKRSTDVGVPSAGDVDLF